LVEGTVGSGAEEIHEFSTPLQGGADVGSLKIENG